MTAVWYNESARLFLDQFMKTSLDGTASYVWQRLAWQHWWAKKAFLNFPRRHLWFPVIGETAQRSFTIQRCVCWLNPGFLFKPCSKTIKLWAAWHSSKPVFLRAWQSLENTAFNTSLTYFTFGNFYFLILRLTLIETFNVVVLITQDEENVLTLVLGQRNIC